jgi:hypothetical protein
MSATTRTTTKASVVSWYRIPWRGATCGASPRANYVTAEIRNESFVNVVGGE